MAFVPVEVVNDPTVIARNHAFVSINGALSVDLYGQVVADNIDGKQISGVGGHEDFVAGAELRLDDHSLICLRSTAVADGVTRSRIVPLLPEGSVVSTPRHHTGVVITEYGAADLSGLTVRERAAALAEIAHPDFRDRAGRGGRHPRAALTRMAGPGDGRRSLTLATFNVHMGVDGWGRPSTWSAACAGLDADVLVMQESWAPDGGDPSTAGAGGRRPGLRRRGRGGAGPWAASSPRTRPPSTSWGPVARARSARPSASTTSLAVPGRARPTAPSSPGGGGWPCWPGSRSATSRSSRSASCGGTRPAGR